MLLFLDPTEIDTSIDDLTSKEEPGFMDQMLGSIQGMFEFKERTATNLGKDLSSFMILIETNATNPWIQNFEWHVQYTGISYLVILQERQALFQSVTTKNTDEVLDIIGKAEKL